MGTTVSRWKLQFSGILLNCFLVIQFCNLCSSFGTRFSVRKKWKFSSYFLWQLFQRKTSLIIQRIIEKLFILMFIFSRGVSADETKLSVILRHFPLSIKCSGFVSHHHRELMHLQPLMADQVYVRLEKKNSSALLQVHFISFLLHSCKKRLD